MNNKDNYQKSDQAILNKLPTKQLQDLYKYYPGDESWEAYIDNFPEIDENIKTEIPLDDDMVRAIYYHMSDMKGVQEYLDYKVPRLDGYTPVEVFQFAGGRRILRTAIMRMK